jgi:pimeloyl-ACP methyl ester carboxylesterase
MNRNPSSTTLSSTTSLPLLHPYAILGGSTNPTRVHGEDSTHKVDRHSWLIHDINTAKYHTVTTDANTKPHRIYYSRIFGGEFRERTKQEANEFADECDIKILLVQGLAGTHANWECQVEFFASHKRCDVVAIDNRGVGFSDEPFGRWKTTDMANDIISLCRNELKNWEGKTHLIGFSLGGMCAIEAACLAPSIWKSVTLISTHAGGLLGTIIPPWGYKPMMRTFGDLASVDSLDAGLEILHPPSFLDQVIQANDEDLAHAAKQCLGPNTPVTNRFKFARKLIQRARKYVESNNAPEIRVSGVFKQATAGATHHVGWDRLQYLKFTGIPFLVIAGELDNLVNAFNARILASALNCPILMKHDAGHGINEQYEDEVNQVLWNHIVSATDQFVPEGRVPLPKEGPKPGLHPWLTTACAFLPSFLLARKYVGQEIGVRGRKRRITWWTIILMSLIVRFIHGPLWYYPHKLKWI